MTIGGNTPELFSGSASVLPAVTAARHCITAFSTTLLPAVRAVMRRPSRMGTPDDARRIDHGGLDLPLERRGLLDVRREALEDGVEDTARLAHLNEVDEQIVER